MYNKEIKVVDCTIRDGGLINKWQFSHDMVKKVFQAINASGVDYMEMGYRASTKMFPPEEYGTWRFTRDHVVREIIGDTEVKAKLGVMVDIGRVEEEDIHPADESPLDFFRIATYLKDVDKAIELAKLIVDKGYETFINIMAISAVSDSDLAEGLQQISDETDVTCVNIVDSFGALMPHRVAQLVNIYKDNLKKGKSVGMHAHNNLQMGFANSLEAIKEGVSFCDATITGIGRAAGNCPMELLLTDLKNPKYNIEPIYQVMEDVFVDLRKEIEWGYLIPYLITAALNEHPRAAMALRNSEDKDKYAEFYKTMTTPECEVN
ncbi:MAG: aldolase catalytic domain-containing protein [Verrucomicrobiota bacterium]|nr:aldolase catalytic domain-containing protein [Verrucomicrobiota bacterium]